MRKKSTNLTIAAAILACATTPGLISPAWAQNAAPNQWAPPQSQWTYGSAYPAGGQPTYQGAGQPQYSNAAPQYPPAGQNYYPPPPTGGYGANTNYAPTGGYGQAPYNAPPASYAPYPNAAPQYSNAAPAYSNAAPAHSNAAPAYQNAAPAYPSAAPTYPNSLPPYSGATPNYAQASQQPGYIDNTQSAASASRSNWAPPVVPQSAQFSAPISPPPPAISDTAHSGKIWQIPSEPIKYPLNALTDSKVLGILTKARPFLESKDYQQAEPMLLEAVAMDPNHYSMNTHNYLGLIYENENRTDDSISEYQKMLTYDPKSELGIKDLSNAYCRKAKELNDGGQTKEALSLLQEAVRLNPNHAMFHNNLGSALQTLGDLEGAIKEYGIALTLEPGMELATLNTAKCYLNLGEFDQARVYFNRFIQEHPNSPKVAEAQERLRYLASKQGQTVGNKNGPDYFRETTATALLKWPMELMPIRVYINWNPQVDGLRPLYAQALIEAFNDWSQATNYKVTWLQVNSPNDANIVCSFASDNSLFKNRDSDSHEQGEVSGYQTFIQGGQKFMRHCNLAISTHNALTGKNLSDGEIHNVALHETGHTLGLLGHSPNYHDIMYFITNPGGGGALRNLSARDVSTINILYANYPPRGTAFRQ